MVQSALVSAISRRWTQTTLVQMLIGEVGSLDFGYGVVLQRAVDVSSLELVKLLLRHGADPDTAIPAKNNPGVMFGNTMGWNATILAAVGGKTDIVEALVEAGGDPDFLDHSGRTPLSFAAERGHVETVQLLLGYGVEVALRDKVWHRRPLDWAVLYILQHPPVPPPLLHKPHHQASRDQIHAPLQSRTNLLRKRSSCVIVLTPLCKEFSDTEDPAISRAGVAFIFLYAFFWAFFFNSAIWVIVSKIFPLDLRATGVGFAMFTQSVTAIWLSFAASIAFDRIQWRFYFVFIATNILALAAFYVWLPETNQLTLEEIAARFGDVVAEPVGKSADGDGLDAQQVAASGVEDPKSGEHVEYVQGRV
ncbi:uncharacterized protein DSM5745_08570 [Aspergillus mulundensis]|uniref:Uncharacterized protein n=1 Tax=Aspergillus mulundensis TaxID=1810919 RepID=A0A3D8R4B6_9EURO|nr:hypothetical protein DSM5745_08570 [Aspergillus mulundensis]RDW68810.1 hypothetical protein DSM5745_08570 [Aspergillus mulundensis]